MLKPKSIEEACQLVKLSQHLDSSIYGVKHQENNPYTEREREPVCQAVKAPREYGQHNHLDSQLVPAALSVSACKHFVIIWDWT
jgi:hypothetical protein